MLELMVLSELMIHPSHGYDLKKQLQNFNPNNNKIYPLLRNLLSEGYVTQEIQLQDNKPSRKVYTITEKGKKHLVELLEDFDQYRAMNDDEFYMRVAFFQFMDREYVEKILDIREAALKLYSANSGVVSNIDRLPDLSYDILFLHNYINSRVREEYKFINALRDKYGINKKK